VTGPGPGREGGPAPAGMPARRLLDLPGDRQVEVLLASPADGLPLVLHNGTPSGPVVWTGTIEAARARGRRTILVARPGYGASTPRPGRRVADVAADVAAVLDALGCGTFVTVGSSGGGPHALACSALLPGRCLGAATLAGVAPYRADGLDFLAGMGPENIAEFRAAVDGDAAITAFIAREADGLRTIEGAQVAAELGVLVSEADRAVLAGGYADHLAAKLRSAVSGGIAGWRDDDLAFVSDWGFPLASVGPVAIWQGSRDLMVPAAHGRWLAGRIPGARARLHPEEGHLTLEANRFGEVLDDLNDLAGR
jgi:pimeloyl-ACP methyl ester carboxylesterase